MTLCRVHLKSSTFTYIFCLCSWSRIKIEVMNGLLMLRRLPPEIFDAHLATYRTFGESVEKGLPHFPRVPRMIIHIPIKLTVAPIMSQRLGR
jgi:hypothetical protein